jgi:photosystem II stability/assembly factor-like uncharacterized protein
MKSTRTYILVCLLLVLPISTAIAAPPDDPTTHSPSLTCSKPGSAGLIVGDDVAISLTAYNPPITIPSSGGTFGYTLEVIDSAASASTFDVWTTYTFPDGTSSDPVFGPASFHLPDGWSADRDLSAYVDDQFPTGHYTYTAHVGIYPTEVWGTDNLSFEKLPPTVGWYPQSPETSTTLNGVQFPSADQGWAVGESNTIIHTTDGGDTWYPQDDGQYYPQSYEDVCFVDVATGWVVGSVILHTTDAGVNWIEQNSYYDYPLYGVSFLDSDLGWAVGGFVGGSFGDTYIRVIEHTTDGGATWTGQLEQYDERPLQDVTFVDANHGWAVGELGAILYTANGGSNWNEQASGTSADLLGVSFIDANNGWCCGEDGVILHTTNGGAQWAPQDSGTDALLDGVQFVDASTGWAVGVQYYPFHAVILHTVDGGQTWHQQDPGTADAQIYLRDVCFHDAQQGWTVGGFYYPFEGVVLHTESGGGDDVNPVLAYTPTSHDFGDLYKGDTASTTFEISNAGTGTLNYFFYPCVDMSQWVSVTPESGYSNGDAQEITVDIDTAGLAEGVHQCDVQVFTNGGNALFTVYVNVLPPSPVLAFSPKSFDFGDVGQNQLVIGKLQIWNAGTGILYYNFNEGCGWVVCDPWSGSSAGEVDEIDVQCFTSPLTLGPHQCDVTINSSAGPGVFTVRVNVVP